MDKSEIITGDDLGSSSNSLNPDFKFEESNIYINDFLDEANKLSNNLHSKNDNKSLLTIKTANEWIEQAKTKPIPRRLFDDFWYEGEVCILFSDSNIGKSILAVQIADSISRGSAIEGFKFEANRQSVIYCDFELTDKQFESRYSYEYSTHYKFNDELYRIEINPDAEFPEGKSFEEYLNDSLNEKIILVDSKIIIIDNISFLRGETEKSKDATPLMRHLKELKNKHGLSILIIAHTPKRDMSRPITINDLAGSRALMNFCDSSFAIGPSSTDTSIRYIKQLKCRQGEKKYESDNVCVCELEKLENFSNFKLIGFSTEYEHLKQINESHKTELENQIRNILLNEPNISSYKIAKRLCDNESKFESFKVKVNRIVKKIGNTSNNGNNCS